MVSVRVAGTSWAPGAGRARRAGEGRRVGSGAHLACSSMHVNTLGANMVPPAPSFPAAICLAGAPGGVPNFKLTG